MKFLNIAVSWRELKRAEKINYILLSVIRLTLVIAILSAVYNFEWLTFFVAVLAFVFTYAPKWFEMKYNIDLPIELEIIAVLFIYASLFLGEIRGYYTRFWWWDAILHGTAAVALGFIGFIILYVLYKSHKIRAGATTIAVFSFFFSLGIGALWEIFEFAMDGFFGLNMQKSGLVDTMWDLITDAVGALIASLAGYFYIKNKKMFFVDRIIEKFSKDNPQLFTK